MKYSKHRKKQFTRKLIKQWWKVAVFTVNRHCSSTTADHVIATQKRPVPAGFFHPPHGRGPLVWNVASLVTVGFHG